MNILVACEESQTVCIEFRKRNHNAFSADIQECSGGCPEWHILGDVLPLLNGKCTFKTMDGCTHSIPGQWDMIIGFPPCTYLTRAGACNIPKNPDRIKKGFDASIFFKQILTSNCKRICVENPPPMKRFNLPKYSQIIQPFYFGEPYHKPTCLWLKGLPNLQVTNLVEPEKDKYFYYSKSKGKICSVSMWYQKANTGKNRSKNRSKTFKGVAIAMAEQWGSDVGNFYLLA